MKLLLSIHPNDGDLDAAIRYVIVTVDEEMKKYLHLRRTLVQGNIQALTNMVGDDDEDLFDMRFCLGFSVMFCSEDLDISKVISKKKDIAQFEGQGWWIVEDGFPDDNDIEVETELDLLVMTEEAWQICAHEKDGIDVATREIPYHILGDPFELIASDLITNER